MHSVERQRLYLQGILHRDMSQGNILIFPMASDVRETKGGLIDLDKAKVTESFIQPVIFREPDPSRSTVMRISINKLSLDMEFEEAGIEIEPDTFRLFEKLMGHENMERLSARDWVEFTRKMMDILGIEKV